MRSDCIREKFKTLMTLKNRKLDACRVLKAPARWGHLVRVRTLGPGFITACLLLFGTLEIQAQPPLQSLPNQVRPEVLSGKASPAGLMPSDQKLNLTIVLGLRHQGALTGLLSRLYDPSSADYRRFLTPAEFADQFGPSAAEQQAVIAFAQAHGFSVGPTAANRMVVPITGTVAEIEGAFHVKMGLYHHPEENRLFYSPDRQPALDLGVPVAHIGGLDNYSIPRPMTRRASPQSDSSNENASGSGPGGSFLATDMRAAYYGGTALTGAGQTVGLVEFDGYSSSDVEMTLASVGQSTSVPVNNVLLDQTTGASVSGDDSEEVIDIVQALGMAPGLSQVRVYIGSNDVDILNAIAAEDLANEVSISWSWTPDDPATDEIFFEECAAQGQSVFAASGDWGEFDPYFDKPGRCSDPCLAGGPGHFLKRRFDHAPQRAGCRRRGQYR
jgi:subtilase family serine protease